MRSFDLLSGPLFALLCLPLAAFASEDGAPAMARPLRLLSVAADRDSAPVFDRVTLSVQLEAAYDNPFDSAQIRLDARVIPPEGDPWVVPGFMYRPYARSLDDDKERIDLAGPPEWQVRLSFPAPGRYEVVVSAADATGTVSSEPLALTATAADRAGMIRRHPRDHRYFMTDRGETFYAIGANVCWGGSRGTFDYDLWLPKYAEQGANFLRVWLNPDWFTFAMSSSALGFDRIHPGNAWRLDYVLELAERLDMRVMLCIDSFNSLRSEKSQYGAWESGPFNQANGGPLERPGEYFTNETMRAAYRDRLRYLVARYGYSPAVFAWEFWNEVDIIDEYDSRAVADWHRDMARFLRSIDPWRHLIGTSHARSPGDALVDTLPELDFVQTHRYGARDMALILGEDRDRKLAARDRPHFHGEFGISHDGRRTAEIDPHGVHLRDGLYASVGQLHAGTPMTWWWDSYVEPRNLYPLFGAFARWIDGFDFAAEQVRAIDAAIALPEGVRARIPDDDILRTDNTAWDPAPYNQPVTARIGADGRLASDFPVPRLQHGVRNHPTLHNPVTFEVDAPEDTTFGVLVEGVSGHGGAGLRIYLDGELARDEDFADTEPESTRDITRYNGVYSIDLSAGRHVIKVENPGNDWFYAAFKIPWLNPDESVPLRPLGVVGESRGLVWVHNRTHNWPNATRSGFAPVPIENAVLRLRNWPAGTWTVESWDTARGEVTDSRRIDVAADGLLELALPPVSWDAAFRMIRQ